MAKRFEPREFEESAIALHGVDKAKDAIEASPVVGLSLPGDDLAAQRFEHFAAFGYEIGNQIVHWIGKPPALVRIGLCRGGVNAALSLSGERCTNQQHRAGGVRKLDGPACFRSETVCEPCAGCARLDRAFRS